MHLRRRRAFRQALDRGGGARSIERRTDLPAKPSWVVVATALAPKVRRCGDCYEQLRPPWGAAATRAEKLESELATDVAVEAWHSRITARRLDVADLNTVQNRG